MREQDSYTPYTFFSSLSGAQRNYSAGQLEAWALVSACRKWRTYLGARGEVELITDHCPLKWVRSQKDPRRTFARWILELEEYSYNITHRPENNLPDYLSRNPNVAIDAKVQDESIFEDKVFTLKTNVRVETRWDAFLMRKQQNQDPVTKDALNQLEKEGRVSTGQLCNVPEDLNVTSDLLLFRDRVVVPSEAQDEVMRRVTAGHFGQKRTLQNLLKSYFWIGMARDTRKYCRICLTCQKAKGSNRVKVTIQVFELKG